MSEVATLAGGCFWCLEAIFERVSGVERVESGFSGGDPAITSYRAVCEGTSGHAEVVQVTFDPAIVSYAELLQLFFVFHDPTTLDRQGADVGTQYRSAIFTHSAEQQATATALIAELDAAQVWPNPIVTQVAPFDRFFPAEEHHQGYYRANPQQPYCQAAIAPKVAKLRAHFASRLKPEP
ncbi:MAG: peptide-methionine (S)-S-oxide reductase MsrA [Candidatus Eisenbacteria bacterium]|nr:peptide-methionine (S)-S-oxide reductase MsrA [Candidatus Eisenbacteria bacterium]